jgi:hypothetical protein
MISAADYDGTSLPILFELAIRLYSLIKNHADFFIHSRLDELVEFVFQRYRSILKYSSHLPDIPKAENLILIYTPKKVKSKVKYK